MSSNQRVIFTSDPKSNAIDIIGCHLSQAKMVSSILTVRSPVSAFPLLCRYQRKCSGTRMDISDTMDVGRFYMLLSMQIAINVTNSKLLTNITSVIMFQSHQQRRLRSSVKHKGLRVCWLAGSHPCYPIKMASSRATDYITRTWKNGLKACYN